MAKREKDFIDFQPTVYADNHEKDIDSKPALIQYLERIELDPELENFYPELRMKEDCISQQLSRENDLFWSSAVQECDVCFCEKYRYPGCTEKVDRCLSRAFFTTHDLSESRNQKVAKCTGDVTRGVENCYSGHEKVQYKADCSLFLSKDRNESLSHKSDLGFHRNYQNRKNVMMRDTEGCEGEVTGTNEEGKYSSQTERVGRRCRVSQTIDRSSKRPPRSRIEINMVNVVKRAAISNRDHIEERGDRSGSQEQLAEQLGDGLTRQGRSGNYQSDDRNGIASDENGIICEAVHYGSLANLRESDRLKMLAGAREENTTVIGRQTESNTAGFTWRARQRQINNVKTIKKPPVPISDADVMPTPESMPSANEGEREQIQKSVAVGVGDSELKCDIKCLPQTRLSAVNGVKQIGNCQAVNDCQSIQIIRDGVSTATKQGNQRVTSTKSGELASLGLSERKEAEAEALGDSFSMKCQNTMTSDVEEAFDSDTASKLEVTGSAVVKSTNSQFVNINEFNNQNKNRKSDRTKQSIGAQPESFVISIDSNEEDEAGNCFEGKNKWLIEIVDREGDNIGFIPSIDTAGIHLSGDEYFDEETSKKGGDPAEDKKSKTIKCLGDRNPVLENRRSARKSIEKGLSQKCIVSEDLEEKVNDGLSSPVGKMWRKNVLAKDTAKQSQSSAEKSKLFYQGQGVQLRLNIKKPTDSLSNAPKDEQAWTGDKETPTNRAVSTAKAVSLKSTLKSVKTEGNLEKESGRNRKGTLCVNKSDKPEETDVDLDIFDKELVDILNYEPPKLQVPVVGKGHVEFGLKKSFDEDSLKMENARLSKLLLEVEQARSTTVKALLSANSVLHKVNDANTELEGALKTLNTDKKFLELEIEEYKEKLRHSNSDKDIFSAANATEFESSMKVIISSWKKEKQELLSALAKSSLRVKRVEADADGLRVAFQRVKDQLENSNETFTKLLEYNLKASVKVEEEMKELKEEKALLSEKILQNSEHYETVRKLEDEIVELKSDLESANDEKEELYKKISHLEKKNKQLSVECEELQEQLDHSQEIVDKLAEKEEELKERLEKEESEKEYLQDCLDETGQILLHLRNNEKKLLDEKGELEEDLEEEMQVNESLQQSLKSTMKEHQELVNRLQDMTSVHLTVKKSLDQASKKEKSYQQQIASLTKTNSILHYSLEKEKEEKIELRETYENSESQWKIFKHDRMLEVMDLKKELEDLTETEAELKLQHDRFFTENENLRVSLEHEEEENEVLRKRVALLEEWKETNESDLERLREDRDSVQNEADDLKKRVEDLNRGLGKEKERYDTLMCTLEDTEESLDKSLKDLSRASNEVSKLEKEMKEVKEQVREKTKKVREYELKLAEEIGEKDRVISKSKNLESELSKAKKCEEKQREEIETCQMHIKRLEREKMCLKRALEESKQDFDTHRERCVENFQKLREELVGVQNKLVEKDREAMKQKENWQDAIDNTAADLKLLRDFLGGGMSYKSMMQGNSLLREVLERDSGADIEVLRRAYHRAESEMMRDVSDLEGMLRVSKEQKNTVAVVQSPMSKIKLSEIKKLRDEMYELNSTLLSVRNQISDIIDEVLILKNGEKHGECDNKTIQAKSDAILKKLKELDLAILKLENDHDYVIEKNSGIINRGIANVSREKATDEVDSSSESAYEGEDSDAMRKEIMNSQLMAENEKLKKNIEFLKSNYQVTVSNGNDSDGVVSEKRNLTNHKTVIVEDTPSVRPSSSQKYIPPTSMRYPPKYGRGSPKHEQEPGTGHQSTDSGPNDRSLDCKTKLTSESQNKPSYFAAEMSLFHHDESLAADILRRKLKSKHYLRESKSEKTSFRNSGSLKGGAAPRIQRSGSVEDDDENDEDSDLSAGELRRSKTLPRRFKTRAKFV